MGTVSTERFTKILSEPTSLGRTAFVEAYRTLQYDDSVKKDIVVSAESADELLEQVRVYLVKVGYLPYKQLRPWEMDPDLYSELDQNEKWWGWEFETGYNTAYDCGVIVGHVWDTWNNVCFDGEGEGAYVSEITFAPTEASKFADRSASAYQFMQYLSDNKEKTNRTDYDSVGTHLNFSTPAMRSATDFKLLNYIAASLNNSIKMLSVDAGNNPRKRLFGRDYIYGGCFERADSRCYEERGAAGMKWIECKLFRTTYTIEEYDQYVRTATGMMKCVDALEAAWEGRSKTDTKMYISNFLEVVDDGVEPVVAMDSTLCGDGSGEYVSGQYMNDYDSDDDCDCDECRRNREGYYDSGDSW